MTGLQITTKLLIACSRSVEADTRRSYAAA
jgi:hypothetical protein